MVLEIKDDFSLERIADSGQCFRWEKIDVGEYRIIADKYKNGYPYDKYSPYNGVYQQYMFSYYREVYNE